MRKYIRVRMDAMDEKCDVIKEDKENTLIKLEAHLHVLGKMLGQEEFDKRCKETKEKLEKQEEQKEIKRMEIEQQEREAREKEGKKQQEAAADKAKELKEKQMSKGFTFFGSKSQSGME